MLPFAVVAVVSPVDGPEDNLARRMKNAGWSESEILYYTNLMELGENAKNTWCYDATLLVVGAEGHHANPYDLLYDRLPFRKVSEFNIEQTSDIMNTLKPRDILYYPSPFHFNRVLDIKDGAPFFLDKYGSLPLEILSWEGVKNKPERIRQLLRSKGLKTSDVNDFIHVTIYRPDF